MNTAAPRAVLAFDGARVRDEPFPHFVAPRFYAPEFADTLLGWLENDAVWQLKQTRVYEQWQLGFNDFRHCEAIAGLFDAQVLRAVRDAVARSFGATLTDRVNISAHKLLPGQFANIHTDNVPGETHRMVVQLNRGRAADSGGNLVFLSGPAPGDLHTAFRQVSNTAIGFRLGEGSYHAITRVREGIRYTLIYTFLSQVASDQEYRYFRTA